MKATRKFVVVKDNMVSLQLPPNLNGKKVEVIVIESEEEEYSVVKEPAVNWEEMYGSMKSNLSIEEIDARVRALRNEWDRGF
jgi:hypothetical protein